MGLRRFAVYLRCFLEKLWIYARIKKRYGLLTYINYNKGFLMCSIHTLMKKMKKRSSHKILAVLGFSLVLSGLSCEVAFSKGCIIEHFGSWGWNDWRENWKIIKEYDSFPKEGSGGLVVTDNNGGGNARSSGVALKRAYPTSDLSHSIYLRIYGLASNNQGNLDDDFLWLLSNADAPSTAPSSTGNGSVKGDWVGFAINRNCIRLIKYNGGAGTVIRSVCTSPSDYQDKFVFDLDCKKQYHGCSYRIQRYNNKEDWYKPIVWGAGIPGMKMPERIRYDLLGSTRKHNEEQTIGEFSVYTNNNDCGFELSEVELVSSLDHYQIHHDGSALTCAAETIEIKACADKNCSSLAAEPTTVKLKPATGWVQNENMTGNSFTFTGIGTARLEHGTAENVTLGILDLPKGSYKCVDSAGQATRCSLPFYDSGFIFNLDPEETSNVHLATSCQSKNIPILAVRKDEHSQRCVPYFANKDVGVAFHFDYNDPNTGTMPVSIEGTELVGVGHDAKVRLHFNENGESSFAFSYPDAGRITLQASHRKYIEGGNLFIAGNTDVVVKPAGFCVYTDDADSQCASGDTNDSDCTAFLPAGGQFFLKVKGVCAESGDVGDTDYCVGAGNTITPNFRADTARISHNLIAPSLASGGVPGSIDKTSISPADLLEGGGYRMRQAVSEVGVFRFTFVPPTNYHGVENAFGSKTYTSANIGRFVPDHFELAISPDPPEFQNACNGLFTYLGQPFGWQTTPEVTLRAVAGGKFPALTTTNYKGEFWRLDRTIEYTYEDTAAPSAVSDIIPSASTQLISPANIVDGVGRFALNGDYFKHTRPGAANPVNSFLPQVTFTIPKAELTDRDGVCYRKGAGCDDFSVAGIEGVSVKHGRIVVHDNFGAQGEDIENSPFETQYWNDSIWVINDDDDCTSSIGFDTPRAFVTSTPEVKGGKGLLTVSGAGPEPTVQVNAISPSWLACDGSSDCTGDFTFGLSRGNDRIINWREVSR